MLVKWADMHGGPGLGRCPGWGFPLVLTLVEDVDTWLVGIDGLQDFGVGRKDPDDVPMVHQQFLSRLQL